MVKVFVEKMHHWSKNMLCTSRT